MTAREWLDANGESRYSLFVGGKDVTTWRVMPVIGRGTGKPLTSEAIYGLIGNPFADEPDGA